MNELIGFGIEQGIGRLIDAILISFCIAFLFGKMLKNMEVGVNTRLLIYISIGTLIGFFTSGLFDELMAASIGYVGLVVTAGSLVLLVQLSILFTLSRSIIGLSNLIMKSKVASITAFNAKDSATPWFSTHDINPKLVRFNSYDEPLLARNNDAIILVGTGQNSKNENVGFVIEVVSGQGVVDSEILVPEGVATWDRTAARIARQTGKHLMDVLVEMAKAHRAKHGFEADKRKHKVKTASIKDQELLERERKQRIDKADAYCSRIISDQKISYDKPLTSLANNSSSNHQINKPASKKSLEYSKTVQKDNHEDSQQDSKENSSNSSSNKIYYILFVIGLAVFFGYLLLSNTILEQNQNRFWDEVKASPSKEMYEAYLTEYPDGHYVRIAHIKLNQYQSSAPVPVPQQVEALVPQQLQAPVPQQVQVPVPQQAKVTTMAKLTIRSNVLGDKVVINGENKGSTRLDLELKEGLYELEISKSGYHTWKKSLQLKAGSEQIIRAKLKKTDKLLSLKELKIKAVQGGAEAQYKLGLMYEMGAGSVAQDFHETLKWYRKSAQQAFPLAQFKLGVMYHNGIEVPQSHKEAVKWFLKSAKQGEKQAQYALAVSYSLGLGVKKSDLEAFEWFKKAAKQSFLPAQYALGHIYQTGKDVPKDVNKAFYWYKKSAEQGYGNSYYTVGYAYLFGDGVKKNIKEAKKWFLKASKLDNDNTVNAEFQLGGIYSAGTDGITVDYKKAAQWYLKAANKGDVNSAWSLGNLYLQGKGVPQDYDKGIRWLKVAAKNNDKAAKEKLTKLGESW